MAEGLWKHHEIQLPSTLSKEKLLFSMVKVTPDRIMEYQIFKTEEESNNWSTGFTVDEQGFETRRIGFHEGELDIVNDPTFNNQLFVHEFCELYKKQAKFPNIAKVTGSASGCFISNKGHIATNYHIVSGIIEAKGLDKTGLFHGQEILAPSLKVDVLEDINSNNELVYRTIDEVFLTGTYSKEDAFKNKLDLSVIKINYTPKHFLELRNECVQHLEKVYSLGFPMRTAREENNKQKFGYSDANYDLRFAAGLVTNLEDNQFLTDGDGGPGGSGSAGIDSNGKLVGIYTGSIGNGLVNNTGVYRRFCYSQRLIDLL